MNSFHAPSEASAASVSSSTSPPASTLNVFSGPPGWPTRSLNRISSPAEGKVTSCVRVTTVAPPGSRVSRSALADGPQPGPVK